VNALASNSSRCSSSSSSSSSSGSSRIVRDAVVLRPRERVCAEELTRTLDSLLGTIMQHNILSNSLEVFDVVCGNGNFATGSVLCCLPLGDAPLFFQFHNCERDFCGKLIKPGDTMWRYKGMDMRRCPCGGCICADCYASSEGITYYRGTIGHELTSSVVPYTYPSSSKNALPRHQDTSSYYCGCGSAGYTCPHHHGQEATPPVEQGGSAPMEY
jgi:hypothetical protein